MQNETINHLRHALAHQLERATTVEAELTQAVDSVNACFEAQAVMLEHINSLHQILGMEPIENPFAGLEYQAFPQEQAQ